MRLDETALLPLGMEGEEEEKSWEKDKKTPSVAIKQAAIKIWNNQLYQSSKIMNQLTLGKKMGKHKERKTKWTHINTFKVVLQWNASPESHNYVKVSRER